MKLRFFFKELVTIGLLVMFVLCGNKVVKAADTISKEIVIKQSIPDTLKFKNVSIEPQNYSPTYFASVVVLLVGLITAGAGIYNSNRLLRQSLLTIREQIQSQFLQNNSRVWVHDIIESVSEVINEITLLSTDTRYNSCTTYEVRLSFVDQNYVMLTENERIALMKKIHLKVSKLRLLLSNDPNTEEGQIILSINGLISDAQNKEIALLDDKAWNKFPQDVEKVFNLTQAHLAKYRDKVINKTFA